MIPIAKPTLGQEEADAASRVILSGWVTQGSETAAFERELAEYVGAPHAVAVSSCTTALHLALLVAGVRPGDEVITVSHSFIATANAIRYCGAVPVFVDIDSHTLNIDSALVEGAITPKTRAILAVHQVGLPCDLDRLMTIARRHSIPLVEDAACAIGSEYRGEKIGRSHGDIACFSLHPRKLLTTGDGGMITTANAEWDRELRLLRQHGMSVSDAVRHKSSEVIFESYPVLGFNYRLTDIQAAVGRVQLARLDAQIVRRRELAARYAELLEARSIAPPHEPQQVRSNWQSYVVRLPRDADQKRVMQSMLDNGVSTRRGVMCAHREGAYSGDVWRAGSTLVESERAQDECLILPLFTQMTDDEQTRVVDSLARAVHPKT